VIFKLSLKDSTEFCLAGNQKAEEGGGGHSRQRQNNMYKGQIIKGNGVFIER
jgi:hypothetical protein